MLATLTGPIALNQQCNLFLIFEMWRIALLRSRIFLLRNRESILFATIPSAYPKIKVMLLTSEILVNEE